MRRSHGAYAIALTAAAMVVCAVPVPAQTRAAKPAPRPTADPVVATVNGQNITRKQIADDVLADQESRMNAKNPQYQDRVRPIAASIGALVMKRLATSRGAPVSISRQDVIEWLFEEKSPVIKDAVQNRIRELAIAQYARSKGITLTEADIAKQVSKALDNARTQLRMQGKTDAQVLADLGYRASTIRRGVVSSMYIERLVQKELEEKIGHPLGPDDYRDGRHILVRVNPQPPVQQPGEDQQQPPAADPEQAWAEGKAKIDAIAQEIANKTKTFEKAALDSSDDPSKFREGSLGPFVRGQMVPEFEAVAFSLPVGVVSQPVRTQFGWHLIRIDRTGSELTEDQREQAWQTFVRGRAQALVNEIMSKAKIVNHVGAPEPIGMPMMR